MIRRSFRNYNREELNEKINSIDITRQSNQVITKYFGRVIKVSNVSDIYEVFDINSYLNSKLDQIESNFSISKYDLNVGQDYLNFYHKDVLIISLTHFDNNKNIFYQ